MGKGNKPFWLLGKETTAEPTPPPTPIDTTNIVTLDTEQTITGIKTFNNLVKMGNESIVWQNPNKNNADCLQFSFSEITGSGFINAYGTTNGNLNYISLEFEGGQQGAYYFKTGNLEYQQNQGLPYTATTDNSFITLGIANSNYLRLNSGETRQNVSSPVSFLGHGIKIYNYSKKPERYAMQFESVADGQNTQIEQQIVFTKTGAIQGQIRHKVDNWMWLDATVGYRVNAPIFQIWANPTINLPDYNPATPQNIATKKYVDDAIAAAFAAKGL